MAHLQDPHSADNELCSSLLCAAGINTMANSNLGEEGVYFILHFQITVLHAGRLPTGMLAGSRSSSPHTTETPCLETVLPAVHGTLPHQSPRQSLADMAASQSDLAIPQTRLPLPRLTVKTEPTRVYLLCSFLFAFKFLLPQSLAVTSVPSASNRCPVYICFVNNKDITSHSETLSSSSVKWS